MASQYMNSALHSYRQNNAAGAVMDTDPRKLIEMLLVGVLDRLAHARGCMMRGERAEKHHYISASISIIEHLRLVLDLDAGGEIAHNLKRLYEYMLRRLPAANLSDDTTAVDEVVGLLREIKGAWDGMIPAGQTRH